jgi:hypothetical protein
MKKAPLDRGNFGGISGNAMILTKSSEIFGDLSRLARQNAYHIHFTMDPLFISAHKCDVDRSFQRFLLIGKITISIHCLNMLAYNASSDDGPHALLSGKPKIVIDDHPSQINLNIGPEYQCCFQPSQYEIWLSAHVFKTSGGDWDPKLFDIDLQHVDDIHYQVRDVVDRDNPCSI